MAVEQAEEQQNDPRLHVPAALALHSQRNKPAPTLSAPRCDVWEKNKNTFHQRGTRGHSGWCQSQEVILGQWSKSVLYRPHASRVTFAPKSSATRRGWSSSLSELCPSWPDWPDPNVKTTPSWENDNNNNNKSHCGDVSYKKNQLFGTDLTVCYETFDNHQSTNAAHVGLRYSVESLLQFTLAFSHIHVVTSR